MKIFYSFFIAAVFMGVRCMAQTDLTPTLIFPVNYLPTGPHTFDVMIKNVGSTNIGVNAYKIGWQINNGPVSEAATTAPLYGLAPGNGVRVKGGFNVNFPAAGIYKLKVWTRGTTITDGNNANDTIIQTVKVLNNLPLKNVVMEVFKHQPCCPCVDAAAYEDTAVAHRANYSVVNIYCGSTDVLYNADGDAINDMFSLAHPNVFFDRFLFPYALDLENHFFTLNDVYQLRNMNERDEYYEPLQVSFVSATFDQNSRAFKIKLKAKAYDTLAGDLRFNLYLTEDSVKGYQACAPDPNNYYHNKVLRHMFGGTWGKQSSLPSVMYPAQEQTYEFNYTMPANYKTNQLNLVGLVQTYNRDSTKRRIINSVKMRFPDALTLAVSHTTANAAVAVYPSPADDQLHISIKPFTGQPVAASMTDINGRTVRRITINKTDTELDIADLNTGIYFIRMVQDGVARSFKVTKR